jgi:hypothetical protein
MSDDTPDDTTNEEFSPGDWVQIWARVSDEKTHPEDLVVAVDSHNASPNVFFSVRRDWVTKPEFPPVFATRCTHLARQDDGRYLRCLSNEGHSGLHRGTDRGLFDAVTWRDDETSGYIEETHDAPLAKKPEPLHRLVLGRHPPSTQCGIDIDTLFRNPSTTTRWSDVTCERCLAHAPGDG